MNPHLSLRQRLFIFGGIWLTLCLILLAFYLITETKNSLLESATRQAEAIGTRLANDASIHLHAGDHLAVDALLIEFRQRPEMLVAEVGPSTDYKKSVRNIRTPSPKALKSDQQGLIVVNGIRGIEFVGIIPQPVPKDVFSDDLLFGTSQTPENPFRARIVISVEPIFEQINALVKNAAIFSGILLCFGLIFGWALSGTMISPLRRIVDRVRHWAHIEGASHEPNGSQTNDEIGFIWNSLVSMKQSLDRKAEEIAQLKTDFQHTIQKRTSDLEVINHRLSEIIRLKDDLILQLSHEVKTPLTALSGLIENLRDGLVDSVSVRQKDYLDRIMNLSNQIKTLMSALLHFAIAETGNIPLNCQSFSVHEMTQKVLFSLQPIQEDFKVTLIGENSLQGKFLFADRDRVEQILLNLVHNAIKASPRGSVISIDAFERETEVVIRVKDSGKGIVPSKRDLVFKEPNHSDPSRGNGVGLYICRYLVELHGGRIWFTTQTGRGSNFFFSLPKALPPVEARLGG